MSRREALRAERGFHGVVVWNPKYETNVGTLWRSAHLYGASFLGTIGPRYQKQPGDTTNAATRIPLVNYVDMDDLRGHLPYGCPIVGVELDERAVPLSKFWHPPSALYLMGAEDHGLPKHILDQCHHVIQVEAAEEYSMNVSVAGSIVLYDRFMQRQ